MKAITCFSVLMALWAAGCSDDGTTTQDARPATDATLWPCDEVGKACNAHDPCAINPVCGEDLLCHASFLQDCNDSLDCTTDSCGGPGQCINRPKEGYCALLVKGQGTSDFKCFTKEQRNPSDPCQKCDPSQEPSKWSDASGDVCDDNDPCTKDDRCSSGICEGTFVNCSDTLKCTEDICDGKGGCGHKLIAGNCVIGMVCYKDQEPDKGGCAVCDVSQSVTAWTPLPNVCKIGESCHAPGDKDGTGCGVCDPTQSSTAWSPALDACLIEGMCHASGAKDLVSCGACDPTKSTTYWTPQSGNCLVDGTCNTTGTKSSVGCGVCDPTKSALGWSALASAVKASSADFESGVGGFTLDAAVNGVGWQVTQKRAHGGSGSLYYGNPTTGTYDNAAQNKGSAKLAAVTLPASGKAAVLLWLYLDIETGSGFDELTIKANGATLWTKAASGTAYRRWFQVELNLSSLAGQSVVLELAFDTKDGWSNSGEGVYLDDLLLLTGC